MKGIIFFVIFSMFLSNCAENKNVDEAKKLLSVDSEFSQMSGNRGAAEAFNFYLADSAIELPSGNMPVFGRENIYSGMKPDQELYKLEWRPQKAEVAESGELGYTWGFYTLSFPDSSGVERQVDGKYLNVWKKDDEGNWKVMIDIGNTNK